MYHFFIKPEQAAAHEVAIIGSDVNHIKNVLRMKVGEQICVNDGSHEYLCSIARLDAEEVTAKIEQVSETTSELPSRIVLFQGLPKADKMETIIQKCVELGVHEIVPVQMKRCVVKLDCKKEEAKRKRWQAISESAAKQAGRGLIPDIHPLMTYKEALSYLDGRAAREEAVEEIKLRSRQYAKRQLTWLRRDKDIHWYYWKKTRNTADCLAFSTEILREHGVSCS